MDPYDTNNQSALMQMLINQGRYDEAISALREAVSYTSYIGVDKKAASKFQRQIESLGRKAKRKK